MAQRTLMLSDTHLGRPKHAALSAEALRPLWGGCTRLIINGDVAEVHHPTHWTMAARQTLRLFDLCEEDGVQLTLLSGNHDPYIADQRHLHLAQGSVFVTHGDVMHPAIAPWSPRAGRMRERREQALSAIPLKDRHTLEARLTAAQHASHGDWEHLSAEAGRSTIGAMLLRPWAMAQVLWYWREFPSVAAKFIREHAPQARFAVLGHTHRPGIWSFGELTIINTGSFGFPGRPRAVMIEDDQVLRVLDIVHNAGAYGFGVKPVAQFELPCC